ncbi:MAG: ribonuclease Z [Nocardioidaceae bacterium]
MSGRELVVLGTAAQVPTRSRAHHGALLRWDDEAILFDPGEGTQRQLSMAGVSPSSITRICITHLHGDHCLGLPGVLQRLALDGLDRPVDLYFPASGQEYVDRLRHASAAYRSVEVREHPVNADGVVYDGPGFTLQARALDHRIETYGWRLQEYDGRRMLPDALAARGIAGPDVGRLQREGRLDTEHGRVLLEEVSEPRPGQSFAFVMDTRRCPAAVDLARGVDLLVCESTYLSSESELAASYAHLTAAEAAQIAAEAGARRLVLTHFSQRHADEQAFRDEARRHFSDVHAARDLDRVAVPARL